ncbi:Hsp33 family molecular chaperone HslO [Helicovermis profundi]|uniref:33 kDa chaperonin n=1 Tax=Helicovermis profundi TaxID=3065157 RepID=A0AAU9EQJ9_9FIRM|nr:Hsp33 family molecular chaperone HslO [Clostridia bacterium S502]
MSNKLIRGITTDGNFRFFLIDSTNMVENARKIHSTTPVSSAALGRTLTAASLLGSMDKDEKIKITLQIKGSNLIKTILAVSSSIGDVKGYISNPNVDIDLNNEGKLAVGEAIGKDGKLILIRDLGLKEPYIGQSSLVSGEIAEDLASYFLNSEQQPSVVSLGVFVDKDLSIKSAGGFIVQPMPNTPEQSIIDLEYNVIKLDPISKLIADNKSSTEILNELFDGFEYKILEEKEVNYKCDCSREKMEKGLLSLGKKEIKEMIDEDGKAELSCHFCNHKYNFNLEELRKLYDEAMKY